MKNSLFVKIFLVLSIHLISFSKTVDELVDIIASSNINVQYYFWIKNNEAFLSTQKQDQTYAIWYYTKDRKWRPIHNGGAFDGFTATDKTFSSVVLNKENETIVIGDKINNDNSDINKFLDVLASKTHNIGWYFWITKQDAFLLSKANDNNVRIWYYTSNRKWRPIHNASAFDGFPLALKTINNINFDPISGVLKTGSRISSDMSDNNEMAKYKATITTIWSATHFPINFPRGRHFSPVIGMTHNENVKLFAVGSKATSGIVEMSETGGVTKTKNEINNHISSKNADFTIKGSSLGVSSSSTSFNFNVTSSHSYISWVSMIAPSPDWFIGTNSLNLLENGEWLKEKTINLKVYDAGSDSGDTFSASNSATSPRENITRLTTSPSDTDFEGGKHRSNDKFIATIVISKLEDASASNFSARTFYGSNCTTCHGSDGRGNTVIQGRSESVYMSILTSFQNGSRTSPSGMSRIFKGFDMSNLSSLAKYLSTL